MSLWDYLLGETEKSINNKIAVIFLILLPFLIFVFNYYYPSGPGDGAFVKYRPDPWVYITVWSVIVLCLSAYGVSLMRSELEVKIKFLHSSILVGLVLLCGIWSKAYHTRKKDGMNIFILICILGFTLLPLSFSISHISTSLLSPLLVWLVFQTFVAASELSV